MTENIRHYREIYIASTIFMALLKFITMSLTTLLSTALLLTIMSRPINSLTVSPTERSVVSVQPLHGPVAGGTRVTITGQLLNVSTIRTVYIGEYGLYPYASSSEINSVVVTTLPTSDSALNEPRVISILLKNGSRFDTIYKFKYLPNPTFTNIQPRNHLVVGGTEITVTGSNMESVAEPRITLSVVTNRIDGNIERRTTITNSEACRVSGSVMRCRMPVVSLADDLREQLKNTESATINDTRGPGVAVYFASRENARVDIYIGLQLDGLKRYENISSVNSSIKMQFSLQPQVNCTSDQLQFGPNNDQVIAIKGEHLERGSRLTDFVITVGDAVCRPVSLNDSQVECRPPKNKPNRRINDTLCHDDTFSLNVHIGNAYYYCPCMLRYEKSAEIWTYIAVGACLAVLIVLVISITTVIVRRRRPRNDSNV